MCTNLAHLLADARSVIEKKDWLRIGRQRNIREKIKKVLQYSGLYSFPSRSKDQFNSDKNQVSFPIYLKDFKYI